MKTLFRLFLLLIVLVIIAGIGILGYFGFVPGLSTVMGTNKPKDLGVKATVVEYNSYVKKAGTEINYVPSGTIPVKGFSVSGKKDLKTIFTQEEITGRVNFAKWKYLPVVNVQVKVGQDGSAEATGIVRKDKLSGFIKAVGGVNVSQEDIDKALAFVGLIGNPPFYLKVKGGVTDNKAFGQVLALEVGRIPVPIENIDASEIAIGLTNSLLPQGGINAKKVSFENGQMQFEGTVPESYQVEAGN